MSFTPTQVTFLQRLVAEKPPSRTSEAARFFCENYSLGTPVGREVQYRSAHHEAAQRLLEANDLPVAALGPDASRADSAVFGGMSEKNLSAAPHARSLAVKSWGACLLHGHSMYTPAGAYLVLTPEQAREVSCQRVMLVENLETFRYLEDYAWLDRRGLNVLVVYRGDPALPNRHAIELVKERSEPVWGFFDFDPSGLAIANSLASRLEHLVLPAQEWLQRESDTPRGRQLFDDQVAGCSKSLDASSHPEIAAAWRLMKRLRSAVTQERMQLATRA